MGLEATIDCQVQAEPKPLGVQTVEVRQLGVAL
jgi:hypothetical protein